MTNTWQVERARIASLSHRRPADDPELVTARQNLKALRLEEHVREKVSSWPPLRPEQAERVAGLLRSGGAGK
jgi:hypothetical protein